MKMKPLSVLGLGAVLSFSGLAFQATANAAILSHVPNDGVPPVVYTPPFGSLVPGGEVEEAFIDFGVDYSYGGVEGIFINGGGDEGAIGGINNASVLDLLTAVDGRIVLPGTTTQGLTSFLFVEAGFSDPGTLLLEAFGIGGNLLASVFNGFPLGPHGRTTLTIDRGGVFDIAFFKVSTPGLDTFGVDQVDLETPVAAAVPEPTTALGVLVFAALGTGSVLKRKQQQKA